MATKKKKASAGPSASPFAESMRALALADDRYMLAAWGNTLTEVGFGMADKSRYSHARRQRIVSPLELEALYADDALAQRIVDRMPDDCIQKNFTFCDLPKAIEHRLEDVEN